ncbi:hypothetical protein J4218_01780 [Candidatus Pacearchaeota archaeon]|nr:hypothetical protein [uncultured archaeon]MBS3078828.1 hypothetical protein [Candidatus Pacearchaeota archaeon]
MSKLKKEDFDKTFRFRRARTNNPREGSVNRVNCTNCTSMSGGTKNDDPVLCNNSERFRAVKIVESFKGWGNIGSSRYTASQCICDAYTPHPLPEGASLPIIPENHAILLGSQYADPYHADPNCPYVIEEARMIANGGSEILKRAEICFMDISDKVSGETIRDKCEMPCCETKLPYQILYNPNGYRSRAGLKPDGTEPRIWVRNGIAKHGKNIEMTIEEAEAFFDLSGFQTLNVGFGQIHDRIIAVSNHLHKCNWLGSRPLSEAVNPVYLGFQFHFLEESLTGTNSGDAVWVYNQRLFDFEKGLEKPLGQLEIIPEGIFPCMDTHKVFSAAKSYCRDYRGSYNLYGIVKPLEDKALLSKGLTHFIDINAVSFHDTQHMWGEFGRGFSGLASFHEK